MTGLERAIKKAGGVSKLAAALGKKPNVIGNWRLRERIPAEACPEVERATGVPIAQLRPDVFGPERKVG